MDIEAIARIIQAFSYVFLFFIIGFGPGFIIGILLANRFSAKDRPDRMEMHRQKIQQATEHNSQWNPEHERWRK